MQNLQANDFYNSRLPRYLQSSAGVQTPWNLAVEDGCHDSYSSAGNIILQGDVPKTKNDAEIRIAFLIHISPHTFWHKCRSNDLTTSPISLWNLVTTVVGTLKRFTTTHEYVIEMFPTKISFWCLLRFGDISGTCTATFKRYCCCISWILIPALLFLLQSSTRYMLE